MAIPLTEELEKHIVKPLGSWCDEAQIADALKRRLTKKEYKILLAWATQGQTVEETTAQLNLDAERYKMLSNSVIKKLNNDALKRELFCQKKTK